MCNNCHEHIDCEITTSKYYSKINEKTLGGVSTSQGIRCQACRMVSCHKCAHKCLNMNKCTKCYNKTPTTLLQSERDEPEFMTKTQFRTLCKEVYKRKKQKRNYTFIDNPKVLTVWEALAGSSGASEACKAQGWATPTVTIERNPDCDSTIYANCKPEPAIFRHLQGGAATSAPLPSRYAHTQLNKRKPKRGKRARRNGQHYPYFIDAFFFWGCCTPYTQASKQFGFRQGSGRCHIEELRFTADTAINLIIKEQCVEWTKLQGGEPFHIYLELLQAQGRQTAFLNYDIGNGLFPQHRERCYLVSTLQGGPHPTYIYEKPIQISDTFKTEQLQIYKKRELPVADEIVQFQLHQKERSMSLQTERTATITTTPRRAAFAIKWHEGQRTRVTAGPIHPDDSCRLQGFKPNHFKKASISQQYKMIGDSSNSMVIQHLTAGYQKQIEKMQSFKDQTQSTQTTALNQVTTSNKYNLKDFIKAYVESNQDVIGGFSNPDGTWSLMKKVHPQKSPETIVPDLQAGPLAQYINKWPIPPLTGKRQLENGDTTYLSEKEAEYLQKYQQEQLNKCKWLKDHIQLAAGRSSNITQPTSHDTNVNNIKEEEDVSEWVQIMENEKRSSSP